MSETEATRQNLFFIVGSGRCGTTMLRSVLSAHPDICIPTETQFYNVFRPASIMRHGPLTQSSFRKIVDRIDRWEHVRGEQIDWNEFQSLVRSMPPEWRSILTAFLTAYRAGQGKRIVGEKTPGHIRCMKRISRDFPQAKFIHLVRDPRAVVHSHLNHPSYRKVYGDSVGYAAWKWRSAYDCHQKAAKYLDATRLYLLRYEDLIASPDEAIRALCAFLGVEFHAGMLDARGTDDLYIKNAQTHQMAVAPIVADRIDIWREDLDTSRVAAIELIVSKRRMTDLGYTPQFADGSGLRVSMNSAGHIISGAVHALRHGFSKVFAR
ncbi:sulfotransferase family protein [Parvibaculum sp.]|uniref:sulfotransferase family protein n=1 Tax=Parvibaculum sp. TaxID=2024848 RepID=UPI00391A5D12